MPEPPTTTGDVVAAVLEAGGVGAAFGVISVHNLGILNAIGRRGRLRFVPSRGEAGAVNMADGYARARDALGVAVTSTGTGCGNAAGAIVEARSAQTPLLHLTGQVDTPHLGRGHGFIHETEGQLEMLAAISKRAFRVTDPGGCADVLREAVATALTPPRGPVSVEIPADVQVAAAPLPVGAPPPRPMDPAPPDEVALDRLAARLAAAHRPLLWLGGGARHAGAGARRLADLGAGIVTSVRGRGVVPEDQPLTLGAFNQSPDVEAFYGTCDLMLVVGSRLRSNDTRTYQLGLPSSRVQIDVDPAARGRLAFPTESFVQGDAAAVLDGLAGRLGAAFQPDPAFAEDLRRARSDAEAACGARSHPTTDSRTRSPRPWAGTRSGCGTSRSRTARGGTACSRSARPTTPCIRRGAASARDFPSRSGRRWPSRSGGSFASPATAASCSTRAS